MGQEQVYEALVSRPWLTQFLNRERRFSVVCILQSSERDTSYVVVE